MKNETVNTVNRTEVKERQFVEFSYSGKDAMLRREAVKEASDLMRAAVRKTGGSMPKELIDAYEGLNEVMEHIKRVELTVIGIGR